VSARQLFQQLANNGLDVNQCGIENLDTRAPGVAQQQWEFSACKD
jgi:hypothetical protein